jgi:hypothetical protein
MCSPSFERLQHRIFTMNMDKMQFKGVKSREKCYNTLIMNDDIYTDIAIEESITKEFLIKLDIDRMFARGIKTAANAEASVFKAKGGAVYAYITGPEKQTAGEVHKMAHAIGLEYSEMVPPAGVEDYFVAQATRRFKEVYPGRRDINDEDLRYYKTLVPYPIALLKVTKIKGEIRAFDPESQSWKVVKQMSYSQIKAA